METSLLALPAVILQIVQSAICGIVVEGSANRTVPGAPPHHLININSLTHLKKATVELDRCRKRKTFPQESEQPLYYFV